MAGSVELGLIHHGQVRRFKRMVGLTSDASKDPPNHTAYLWKESVRGWSREAIVYLPLSFVRNDFHVYAGRLRKCQTLIAGAQGESKNLEDTAARESTRIQSPVYYLLQISFETGTKVLKHRRSTREDDVLTHQDVRLIHIYNSQLSEPCIDHDEHQ